MTVHCSWIMAGIRALGIVPSFQDSFNVSVSISGTLPAAHSQLQAISEPGLWLHSLPCYRCNCFTPVSLITDLITSPCQDRTCLL